VTTSEAGDPAAAVTGALPRLEPLRYTRTDALEVAYLEAGPGDGEVTLLLHGFPYDIHSYAGVIPLLAAAGHRVIAPLPARARPHPLPGQRHPAIGTASSHRHRRDRPDGRARHPARHPGRL
jgi:hypothetical protein